MLNSAALLVTDNMTVNPERDSRVRVTQLPLYHGRSCAVRE